MFTAENRQGRLMEVRISWPLNVEEIEEVAEKHYRMFLAVEGLSVAVADLSHSQVFPPLIVQRLIQVMSRVADRIDRSAFLLTESAVLGLQVERAIEEGGGGRRRIFREQEDLITWLGEVLDPAERIRLRTFFAEGVGLFPGEN